MTKCAETLNYFAQETPREIESSRSHAKSIQMVSQLQRAQFWMGVRGILSQILVESHQREPIRVPCSDPVRVQACLFQESCWTRFEDRMSFLARYTDVEAFTQQIYEPVFGTDLKPVTVVVTRKIEVRHIKLA